MTTSAPQPVHITLNTPWFTAEINVNPAPILALLTKKRPR